MLATTAPNLFFVIGMPIAFVLISAGACLGLFVLWTPRPLLSRRLSPGTRVRRSPRGWRWPGRLPRCFPKRRIQAPAGRPDGASHRPSSPGCRAARRASVVGSASASELRRLVRAAGRDDLLARGEPDRELDVHRCGGRGNGPASDADVGVLQSLQPGLEHRRGDERIRWRKPAAASSSRAAVV